MSLFELIPLCVLVAIICGTSTALGDRHGAAGVISGAVLGLVLCFGLVRLWRHALRQFEETYPLLPRCKTGRCGVNDYELKGTSATTSEWTCRCGFRYKKTRTHFMLVDDAGQAEPFMMASGWMNAWRRDMPRDTSRGPATGVAGDRNSR